MIRPLKLEDFTSAILSDKTAMSRFCIDMINNLNDPEYKKEATDQVFNMGWGAVDAYRRHPKKSSNQDYINGYELMMHKKELHVNNHKTAQRIKERKKK